MFRLRTSFVVWLALGIGLISFIPTAHADCAFGNFEVTIPGIATKGSSICDYINNNKGAPITNLIGKIVQIVTAVTVLAGLMALIIGAYLYMTAGGQANRVDMA